MGEGVVGRRRQQQSAATTITAMHSRTCATWDGASVGIRVGTFHAHGRPTHQPPRLAA
jgi:hypothetical protein